MRPEVSSHVGKTPRLSSDGTPPSSPVSNPTRTSPTAVLTPLVNPTTTSLVSIRNYHRTRSYRVTALVSPPLVQSAGDLDFGRTTDGEGTGGGQKSGGSRRRRKTNKKGCHPVDDGGKVRVEGVPSGRVLRRRISSPGPTTASRPDQTIRVTQTSDTSSTGLSARTTHGQPVPRPSSLRTLPSLA